MDSTCCAHGADALDPWDLAAASGQGRLQETARVCCLDIFPVRRLNLIKVQLELKCHARVLPLLAGPWVLRGLPHVVSLA